LRDADLGHAQQLHGLYRPGAIGDFVWEDLNNNGVQDAGEPGMSNVVVNLYDCSNNLLASTTTSANGLYVFTNLPPGGYVVGFTVPAGYVFTLPNAGNDALDSDANPATGLTSCYTLVSGETNLTVDAGLFRECKLQVLESACIIPPPAPCNPLTACTPAYPFASTNPLTSVVFNESEVLRAFTVSVTNDCFPTQIRLWYNDEHALTLGIRQVIVKTASGSVTNNYPITALPANPGSAINPLVGTTALTGDQAGTDLAGRPIFPALFITDITGDPGSLAGDWQYGGTAVPPNAVFGTWKSAVRTVDKTVAPAAVTVTPDADPAVNNWNLGANADAVPAGLVNQGFGAEARWEVDQLGLIPGHTYRLYFMVHDGDQNHTGGDVGHDCVILNVPSTNSDDAADCKNTFSGTNCVPVRYTYFIANSGGSAALNVQVVDSQLGPVPGSPIASLGAGQTVTLRATNLVCSTMTNVVVVSADDGRCSASSQAMVSKCDPLAACTPPYPFGSTNPLTSVVFNESEVLRAFTVSVTNDCFPTQIRLWYNDEHALTLGIRQVIVKTASGSVTNNYPITALPANPGSAIDPLVGSTNQIGDQAGTDLAGRPIFPALYITDITGDPGSLAGDWQYGGTAVPPNAVFGTWKGAVRTVDKTKTPVAVTVTPDADPAVNNWDLGANADAVPAGLVNQGFGAEVRWNVDGLGLIPGHTYRLYFMVHDGDQNKTGGDVGHDCAILSVSSVSCPACITNNMLAPLILTQPLSQTAPLDGSATFNVVAFGSLPLNYQWRLDGTNLPGATGSSLVLSNIQSGQFGNYSVVVSNVVGAAVSSDAALGEIQVPVPTLLVSLSGGNLVFSWSANSPGYELETAMELNGVWTTVIGSPQLVNGQYVVTITQMSAAHQFFRLHKL
jgi:hypothetical protein